MPWWRLKTRTWSCSCFLVPTSISNSKHILLFTLQSVSSLNYAARGALNDATSGKTTAQNMLHQINQFSFLKSSQANVRLDVALFEMISGDRIPTFLQGNGRGSTVLGDEAKGGLKRAAGRQRTEKDLQ